MACFRVLLLGLDFPSRYRLDPIKYYFSKAFDVGLWGHVGNWMEAYRHPKHYDRNKITTTELIQIFTNPLYCPLIDIQTFWNFHIASFMWIASSTACHLHFFFFFCTEFGRHILLMHGNIPAGWICYQTPEEILGSKDLHIIWLSMENKTRFIQNYIYIYIYISPRGEGAMCWTVNL